LSFLNVNYMLDIQLTGIDSLFKSLILIAVIFQLEDSLDSLCLGIDNNPYNSVLHLRS